MEPTFYLTPIRSPASRKSNVNDNNGKMANGKENNGNAGNGASNGAAKFDWVTERSSCSLPKVFATLRVQIEADVKTRNDLRPSNSPYEFSVKADTGEFAVLLKAQQLQQSVVFRLADHAILVQDDKSNPMFEVTTAFSDNGECRLKVNGEERDFWQVRRMALEELMFHGL
ncbi:MAG: hypothetical protein WA899_22565 [Candidatus Sulfotelmatobacter sp.]